MTDLHSSSFASLSGEFLSTLVSDLDSETVTALILHGSYARGEAIVPYSDVDLVRIVQETPKRIEHKQFLYRNGYLISISTRPISVYRERFFVPEKAIFTVPGVREARILLDKDGAFQILQKEAQLWRWEPLQARADEYAGQLLVGQTEIVLKILRALMLHDAVALSDMILDLLAAVTEAIAVQHGVLVLSGNTYFHQVQESVGHDSMWTHYHLYTAGITNRDSSAPSIEERGRTALYLYRETAQLLQPSLLSQYWEVIAQLLRMIEQASLNKEAL